MSGMRYFELLELPVRFQVDKASLTRQYFRLQKQYHPDFFADADEAEQARVMEISSLLNKAYKTLQDPDETIKYILMEKGLMQEEEKYPLPNDFLMDMMELNESLMDAKMEGDTAAMDNIRQTITLKAQELYAHIAPIVETDQEPLAEETLLPVKDYYYKKKYLNRILAGFN
jgi:molecular chaperone HscB